MRLCLGLVLPIMLLSCDTETTDYTLVSSYAILEHQTNPYTGQGSYWIAYDGDAIYVIVHIKLVGDVSDELRGQYEEGIERIWSTDRFDIPIIIDVVWDDEYPDKVVKVAQGVGRWNTSQWYTAGRVDKAAAHECGHYFGLYDEWGGGDAQGFDGGAAPGPRPPHPRGLMSNHNMPTLDYYYDGFLLWLETR